jgi:hypothetical protein
MSPAPFRLTFLLVVDFKPGSGQALAKTINGDLLCRITSIDGVLTFLALPQG